MDLKFQRASNTDASFLLEMQKICFFDSLQKYQDFKKNPYCVKIDLMEYYINNHYYYKIFLADTFAGAIHVHENPDVLHFKLHTAFVLPNFNNLGIAQKAIDFVEKTHNQAIEWVLETPHDLIKNHHIYEKKGYSRTGHEDYINDRLILIHYKKIMI